MSLKAFQYRIQPALILDLGEGVVMPFQYIREGSFWMGSRGYSPDEEPRHFVNITRPFYLGTFPVTQEQFARWKPEHENLFSNSPDHPAEQISWGDAVDYCGWLKKNCADQIPVGFDVGLPTEAQWEYACRAGTDTEYYSGDGYAALATVGWYSGNVKLRMRSVGSRRENIFGLFDMHGNVWEWCADARDEAAYKKRVNGVCDPFVIGNDDADRVFRGGSWFYLPWFCRAAFRSGVGPVDRYWDHGFRVCLFLGPFPGQTGRALEGRS